MQLTEKEKKGKKQNQGTVVDCGSWKWAKTKYLKLQKTSPKYSFTPLVFSSYFPYLSVSIVYKSWINHSQLFTQTLYNGKSSTGLLIQIGCTRWVLSQFPKKCYQSSSLWPYNKTHLYYYKIFQTFEQGFQ